MKKIKIIGFLVIVLFLSIFVFNESLAVDVGADCLVDTQCVPDFPFCGDNLKCVECKHNNHCIKKYYDYSKPNCVNGVCQEVVSVDNSAPRSSKSKSDKSTSGFTPSDARCWTKTDCVEYRKKALKVLDDNDALAGFYSAEDHSDAEAACGKMRGGEVMGFCSPYTEVKTAISFGTVKTFANFGEFVKFIYQYGFLVAGVLAVFMIMVAGIQWLSSAGNQDKIGAAKKRIIGAIVGLLILALSYTILNFINPYLVNFRLPQTWIINKSLMGKEFCHQIPDYNDKEAFKLIGGPNDKLDEGVISSKYKAGNFDLEYNDSFTCGNQYIYSSAPTDKSICRGSICDENSVCIAMPDKKSYQCQLGVLSGKIHPGDLLDQLFGIWDDNAVNDIDFYAVCNNGERKEVPGSGYKIFKDQNDKQGAYVVTATSDNIKSAMSKCGGPEKTAGFLLYPDFDKRVGKIAKAGLLKGGKGFDFNWFDEPHWLGRRPNIKTDESKAVDLGGKYTDFFKKLANNEKINFMAQDYDAGDFLIPVNYFISNTNQKFQLNIVVKEVKGDTN